MRSFQLHRIANIPEGIFGVFKDAGVPFCVTVENNDFVFPDGDYLCRRVNSPKYGNTFEICGIKGRSKILVHWGNWEDNSLGCVIIGEGYDPLKMNNGELKNGVVSSKVAFAEFLRRTAGMNEFMLKVRTSII